MQRNDHFKSYYWQWICLECLTYQVPKSLSVDDSLIRSNGMMVRAFDGIETSACQEIDLKILIGPCEFQVSFIVVDIPAVFNLLLGRPWVRSAGAIPSSLHEKVKFISGNKLITIMAEENILIPASNLGPFTNTQ